MQSALTSLRLYWPYSAFSFSRMWIVKVDVESDVIILPSAREGDFEYYGGHLENGRFVTSKRIFSRNIWKMVLFNLQYVVLVRMCRCVIKPDLIVRKQKYHCERRKLKPNWFSPLGWYNNNTVLSSNKTAVTFYAKNNNGQFLIYRLACSTSV